MSSVRTFQVSEERVRVRDKPGLGGTMVGWLTPGETVEMDAGSRTEADGYVWWQHARGWSAEQSADGTWVFMVALQVQEQAPQETPQEEAAASPAGAERKLTERKLAPASDAVPLTEDQPAVTKAHATVTKDRAAAPAVQEEAPVAVAARTSKGKIQPVKKEFQVGDDQVRVRDIPDLDGNMVKWLSPGQLVEVDPASRTEADGYVWWRHVDGWSAERNVGGTAVFLYEPGKVVSSPPTRHSSAEGDIRVGSDELPDGSALPARDSLFRRLPVDLDQTRFWQYYGNNVFAYNLWRDGKQWYRYAQGLHAGLDFGNSTTQGVSIYAGLEGVFYKHDTRYTRPNGLWVKVGNYIVIYGHVANPRRFEVGQPIGVDTVMGEIQYGGQNHLHLEVRYRGRYIVNPLLLVSQEMREAIITKFPPSDQYFYRDARWTKWQTPLDQPVLKLGGELIGPHA